MNCERLTKKNLEKVNPPPPHTHTHTHSHTLRTQTFVESETIESKIEERYKLKVKHIDEIKL